MPSRLSPVLSDRDLPRPELCALRLDGEVFELDDCVSPVDEVPSPRLRAAALGRQLPAALVIERWTAAWVWGALPRAPLVHQVCADITARTHPVDSARLALREVVLSPGDVLVLDGVRVTSPRRTAIDIARFGGRDEEQILTAIASLMDHGAFGAVDAIGDMDRRRNLPNKLIAQSRLRAAERVSPS